MIVVVVENTQEAAATETNYFNKMNKQLREWKIKVDDDILKVVDFRTFKDKISKRATDKTGQIWFNQKAVFIGDKDTTRDLSAVVEEFIKEYNLPNAENTIKNSPRGYRFEHFLQEHIKSDNSYNFLTTNRHKSNQNVMDFAWKKFHRNILQKHSKDHRKKLLEKLTKDYGAFKVIKCLGGIDEK